MKRRHLIRLSGMAFLAGCTEPSESTVEIEPTSTTQSTPPPHTSTPFPDTTPPVVVSPPTESPVNNRGQITDEDAINSLQDVAQVNGMDIFYQELGADWWVYIEYSSGGSAEETLKEDITVLVDEYIALTENGWNTFVLEAALKDPARDYPNALIASWYCKRDWVEAVLNGGVSREEMMSRVFLTITLHSN